MACASCWTPRIVDGATARCCVPTPLLLRRTRCSCGLWAARVVKTCVSRLLAMYALVVER